MAGGPEASLEIHVVFDGDDPELAAEALDPIRHLGTVIDDRVALTPYADTLEDGATPPPGIQFVTRSAFVDEESVPEVLQILAEVAASKGSPIIALRSVSGAVSRVPNDATAYAHRQAELMFLTLTAGPEPVVEAARPALDAIWGKLAPHVRGAYANFLSSATEEDVAAIYPAETMSGWRRSRASTTPATCSPATTTSGLSRPGGQAAPHMLWGRRLSAEWRSMPPGRRIFEGWPVAMPLAPAAPGSEAGHSLAALVMLVVDG